MAERTKILYVITKANWGGAQRYVFDLATALPKDAFDVSVAFGQKGRLAEELEKAGIQTHEVASLVRDISLFKEFSALFELIRIFKKEKPDIVHLNSSKAGGVGALAARIAGVPRIVFTAHGWPFWEKNRSFLWRALAWLGSWATMLLSHCTICISNYDLTQARRMVFVGNKAVRIYNGIDLHAPLGSGEIIRTAFPAGAQITGTIGELNKNKNQVALIEEAKNDPRMHVAIVGEGELRRTLEEKIREYGLESRVKLFGFIPASEALRGFDAFALPSLKEGLPYVLLEARAAGLPIAANRVGGVGEILDAKDMSEFSLKNMVEKTTALYDKGACLPAGRS
jgi:glycosyltransferase involved in cell wall biosynthesis